MSIRYSTIYFHWNLSSLSLFSNISQSQVKCADGQSLVVDAPESFEINCLGADTTADPDSGLLSCTDCPVCFGG